MEKISASQAKDMTNNIVQNLLCEIYKKIKDSAYIGKRGCSYMSKQQYLKYEAREGVVNQLKEDGYEAYCREHNVFPNIYFFYVSW